MAKRKRDFQRSKVYRAEREHSLWKEVKRTLTASGKSTVLLFTDGTDPMPLDECRDYIEKIMRSRWWKSRCPKLTELRLKDGRGTRYAKGGSSWFFVTINLPRWARSKTVILHELAHAMTSGKYAAHGRTFCYHYLSLIKRWMGRDAWLEMKSLFKENKVKFRRELNQ